VQLLSSLLDVPAQLALVLSLAASTVANDPPSAPAASEVAASQVALVAQPLVGPFRFGEGMWLRALKESPPVQDAPDYSGSIFRTSGGRYYVPAASERRRILNARGDAALASRVARAFARSNARALRFALRRAPSAGELYIAHIFGPEAAINFIQLAEAKPGASAARHVPELARAAPGLLVAHGAPLTLAQVYKRLTDPLRQHPRNVGSMPGAPASEPASGAWLYLKPTLGEQEYRAAMLAALRSQAVAWRAAVGNAKSAQPPQ
jgi:hypothetical protein